MTTLTEAPYARDVLNGLIEAEFERLGVRLREAVAVPDGHAWKRCGGNPTRWAGNDPILSMESGASYFVRRATVDSNDPFQISIEVRFFFRRRPLIGRSGRVTTAGSDADYRTIVWCRQGRPFAGMGQSLLGKEDAVFLRAQSVEALADETARVVNAALQTMKHPEPLAA